MYVITVRGGWTFCVIKSIYRIEPVEIIKKERVARQCNPFPVLLLRYINIRRYLPVSVQLPDLLFQSIYIQLFFVTKDTVCIGASLDPFILVVDNIL